MKLRDLATARSGDKGDTLNVAVVARDAAAYAVIAERLTVARVRRAFAGIVTGEITRYDLPGLLAFNFVCRGALGGGVSVSLSSDPHGKSLSSVLLAIDLDGDSTVDTDTKRYPVLLADVGGTNARFAVLDHDGAVPRVLGTVRTAAHAGFAEAAEAVLRAGLVRPARVVAGVAGPIAGGRARLTNAAWEIDSDAVRRALGCDAVDLVNDFEAIAYALAAPETLALVPIGPLPEPGPGPRLVLGPGTGLGAAVAIPTEAGVVIAPTEAGHVTLGPRDDAEAALWAHLDRIDGAITAEWLVSGPGLLRLQHAAARRDGAAPCTDAAAVVGAARAGVADARLAVDIFLGLLARFAGDVALAHKATGGVVLAGGIVPRLADLIDAAAFRAAFEAKPPMTALMRAIPLHRASAPEPAFAGLAALARDPARYVRIRTFAD